VRFIGNVDQALLERSLTGSTNVLISEPFATKFALDTGDHFSLDTPGGMTTFTVAAVYNDYSSDAGVMLMDWRPSGGSIAIRSSTRLRCMHGPAPIL